MQDNNVLDRGSFRHILERKLAQLMRGDPPAGDVQDFAGFMGYLADAAFERNSPMQRLKRLFDDKMVVPWSTVLPPADDLKPLIETAWTFLNRTRPNSVWANLIDAENLSVVAYHNWYQTGDSDRIVHLTTSRRTQEAAAALQPPATATAQCLSEPSTLDPLTWCFGLYAAEQQIDVKKLLPISEIVAILDNRLRRWRTFLEKPLDPEISGLRKELRIVGEALSDFRNVIDPWHRRVLQEEGRDLLPGHDYRDRTQWEVEFNAAHDRVIAVILDLQAYLEPFVRAARPFFELSERLTTGTALPKT